MVPTRLAVVVLGCAGLLALPARALAQASFEVAGARALGMAGAFVAVADDASAVHWNPAGLVTGGPAGVTIGWDGFRFRNPSAPPEPGGGRQSARLVSFGSWPLGISYGRFQFAGIRAAPEGHPVAEALTVSHFGATVLQTIVDGVVVGATLKYLRGTAGIADVQAATVGAALDRALEAGGRAHGAFDLDVGVMADLGRFRAGVTFKNVRAPSFEANAISAIRLPRRARFGLAAFPVDGLTLAIDVDLDTADPLVGLRRMIAVGGESRLGPRLSVRGGVRWQRRGAARPIAALGGSVRLRQGLWLDGYVTRGHSAGDRGFGIAMRAGG